MEFQLRYTKVLWCSELIIDTHKFYGLDLSKSKNLIEYSEHYFKSNILRNFIKRKFTSFNLAMCKFQYDTRLHFLVIKENYIYSI